MWARPFARADVQPSIAIAAYDSHEHAKNDRDCRHRDNDRIAWRPHGKEHSYQTWLNRGCMGTDPWYGGAGSCPEGQVTIAPMITLHAFGRVHPLVHGLTRDLRVEWALEELELPYHVHGLDHTGGALSRDEFRRINPFKQLPVIEDDGFVLAESGAILVYLADKCGQLKDPQQRATVMRWCFAALTTVEPVIQTIVLMDMENKTDEVTRQRRADLVKVADRGLTGLETSLAQHPYITGEHFTIADILTTTVLRQARRAGLLTNYPRCEAYRQTCEARPAWARAVAAYEARLGSEPGAVERAASPN